MASRLVTGFLIALLAIVQAQLWFGRGSLPQVNEMRKELAQLEVDNRNAQQRNSQIANEVRDLQEGLEMVEELARQDLGMVKPNEIFVQIAHTRP
jgi:cell division protein FtsB